MHLHAMTLQAVGPFAGRHTVDFATLAASGLFLLEGPTGAGKSTVIDAVVFALYGKVASAEASEDRLRSAYAGDDTESFVDLTFEVPSGRYRVRRTPAYERTKKRGSGTVRQQASVRLWRLPAEDRAAPHDPGEPSDPGEILSTRLDEAGAEIQRIVGLDRTQFVQTIVLPQGEFARFLRADPEDRRGLLQKIFGTQVYEDVQTRLVHLRREAERSLTVSRGAVDDRVAHLAGAAQLDAEAGEMVREAVRQVATGRAEHEASSSSSSSPAGVVASPETSPVVGALEGPVESPVDIALECVTGPLAERAAASAARALAAAEEHRRAGELVADQRDLARRIAVRDRLRAEQRALTEGAAAAADAQRRLVSARSARALRPLLRAVDDATQTCDTALKALRAARDVAPVDLAGLVPDLDGPPSEAEASARPDVPDERVGLVAAQQANVAGAAGLERTLEVESRLTAMRLEVRRARGVVEDRDTEIAAHESWLADRPARLDALVTEHAEARAAAEGEGGLAVAVRSAEALRDAHAALRDLLPRHEHALAQVDRCAVAAQTAVQREAALRSARIAGLAGELASTLDDGDACPVCGSPEHPAPARLAADHVSVEVVQDAEAARAQAEAALAAAREACVGLGVEVEAARAATAGSTHAEAAETLQVATAALTRCRAAAVLAARLADEVEEHRAATEARERTRLLAVAERDKAALVVDTLQAGTEQAEAEVARARGDHPTVAARHAELVERAATAGDLLAALDEVTAAVADLGRRRSELAAALVDHDIPDASAARAAALPDAQMAALEGMVDEHAAAVERVRSGLGEPGVADLPADAAADVAGAERAERDAARAHGEASGEAGVAASIAAAARDAAHDLRGAIGRHLRLVEDSAAVVRLAGLASGTGTDNAASLSLATYVLVRRFEDVVAAANARLVGMSDGRYELVRSDRKEDVSSRRTGLAMRVLDHHTEQQRDPRTLSGGETFYVSLCLALGMADVVTAEAGGIDLGTLFVDEGFGSLDPHTLDQVLGELDHLRAGGRVVGVVSHVEALKQTIADRIEIRRTPTGPSTLVVRAG